MPEERSLQDDLGRSVLVPRPPQRIVSLCPSITESVLTWSPERMVGRTRYCIHPAAVADTVATVGGTKNPQIDAIRALQPDLILAEKEENRREDVLALEASAPVYVFDVVDVGSALRMLTRLGEILDAADQAATWRDDIVQAWAQVPRPAQPVSVLYLIWRKPWMGVATDTYIDSVLEHCGYCNVLASQAGRYPQLDPALLQTLDPHEVWLSSEPYPFTTEHVAELESMFPRARVRLVDGELYSWYGVRMLQAARRWQAEGC